MIADAHVHLNAVDVDCSAAALGAAALAVTCAPAEYAQAKERFAAYSNVRVGWACILGGCMTPQQKRAS